MFLVGKRIFFTLMTAMLVALFAPAQVTALEGCNIEEDFPTTRPVPVDGDLHKCIRGSFCLISSTW